MTSGRIQEFGPGNHTDDFMRTVFSIDLKVDIPTGDVERAEAMIDVFKQTAQELYAKISLLTVGKPPEIAVRSNDSMTGQREIEVFEVEITKPKK